MSRTGRSLLKRLLTFARRYLSEAFPNPERRGCPPDEQLRLLAASPLQVDAAVVDHLGCCSPCFSRYLELLAELQRQSREP